MAKLYQVLEQTFKMRINSNAEIIPYIKKISEMGKFDEPKKVAALAIVLDRLGKLEDEASMEKSLQDIASPEPLSHKPFTPDSVGIAYTKANTTTDTTTTQVSTDEMPTETTVSGLTPDNIADKLTDSTIPS